MDITLKAVETALAEYESSEATLESVKIVEKKWWDPLESTCRHASLSIL